MPSPKNDHIYIYDRCEEGLFVLTGADHSISVAALPQGACPGDSFIYQQGAFTALDEDTAARKKRIDKKFDSLFGK